MVKSSKKKSVGKKRRRLSAVPTGEISFEEFDRDSVDSLYALRDGKTFATSSAPWVGAEKAWRQGIVPPPHEDWIHYRTTVDAKDSAPRPKSDAEDLQLTDQEIVAVLSSLPPPPITSDKAPTTNQVSQFLKYAAVAVFTGATVWAVFSIVNHREERTSTAMPTSEQARILVPAAQALPSTESSVAILEKIEAPTAPSVTTSEVSSSSRKPTPARVTTLLKPKAPVEKPEAAVNPKAPLSQDETAMVESTQDLQAAFSLSNPYEEPVPQTVKKAVDTEDLPGTLSREAVQTVMKSIGPEVEKCKNSRAGRLIVELRVSGATGRVIDAEATSAEFKGSPEGFCAARIVKIAKFPKFQDESLTIKYPFDL